MPTEYVEETIFISHSLGELACNLMVQQLMTPTTPPNFATFCANFLVLNFDLFTTTKAYEKFNADNFQLLISKLLVEVSNCISLLVMLLEKRQTS